jgi:hypothetical protein
VTQTEFQGLVSTVSGIQADSKLTLTTLAHLINHIMKEKVVDDSARTRKSANAGASGKGRKSAHDVGKGKGKESKVENRIDVDVSEASDGDSEADADELPVFRRKYQDPLLTQRQV